MRDWQAGGMVAAFAAVAVAGCVSLTGERDAEGFTPFDGRVESEAPSEYFILRYERPNGIYTNKAYYGITKWEFNEVRQLKSGTTLLVDGVLKKDRPKAGRNWLKWIRAYARNIRIKFVDENYVIADDGRESAPDGFVPLFNGKDLDGWKGVTTEEKFSWPGVRRAALPEKRKAMQAKADELMRSHWFVRDGALFFDGLPGGYSLATAKDYGNFELQADWRLLCVDGDSGFYLRGVPQVQIWDPNKWFGLGSGGIWNNTEALSNPLRRADRPIGDWNRCRMRLVGDRLSVWLNGEKVVDDVVYENRRQPGAPLPLIDQIELQCHGDPVEFRNIFIRELPDADVPDPASAVRGARIDLLAGGLDGWEPADPKARMGWKAENGVLSNFTGIDPGKTARGGAGTTHLRTKRDDFFDFDLSYDVLVPAKCNSGCSAKSGTGIAVCGMELLRETA